MTSPLPESTFMPATPSPMRIYQGDSKRYGFRVRARNADGSAGPPADLTDCVPRAQIREDEDSEATLAIFTASLSDQVSNPGVVLLELNPAESAAIPVPDGLDEVTYKWDVELTYPDGRVQTYLAGDVIVRKQVTR